MRFFIYAMAVAASLCVRVSAQSPRENPSEALQSHVPVLPSVKA